MTINRLPLDAIARPSGGLAMLAVDQREAMRNMFAAAGVPTPVADASLRDFKVGVASRLAKYASAVLVDQQFCYDAIIEDGTVVRDSSLIVAADHFIPGNGLPVDDVTIDLNVDGAKVAADGAKALKLLVLWRPDEDPEGRKAMVADFVERCHTNNLIAIIEPVVRAPRVGVAMDHMKAILEAAEELGDTGADLYKGEMPLGGDASDEELFAACKALDSKIAMPWVILSSGVPADLFPNAVRQAVRAGAQGFLAGRAVWASVVGSRNPQQMVDDISAPRLQRLGEIVDEEFAKR